MNCLTGPASAHDDGRRWTVAALVGLLTHGAALGFALQLRRAPPPSPEPEHAEVVFLALRPPPPPAGSSPGRPAPRARQLSRGRPQPLRAPEPKPVVDPAPVPEVAEQAADSAQREQGQGGAGEAGEEGGVAGGEEGGAVGGMVGGTGEALALSAVLTPPRVLQQPRPAYPRTARLQGIAGRVLLRVIVGVEGEVEAASVQFLESISELDAAAREAVLRWRFTPALGPDRRPVRVILEIPFHFSLR